MLFFNQPTFINSIASIIDNGITIMDVGSPFRTIKFNNKDEVTLCDDMLEENKQKFPLGKCNRCKKDFAQMGVKQFKMCEHCRIQQRERSKRWQKQTREKDGVCSRCGTELPPDSGKFVLCLHCREMLRSWKSNRFVEGKCIHCSGPNINQDMYKVCERCRENSKLRRKTLEMQGACNRCSKTLSNDERNFKVCSECRSRKRLCKPAMETSISIEEGLSFNKTENHGLINLAKVIVTDIDELNMESFDNIDLSDVDKPKKRIVKINSNTEKSLDKDKDKEILLNDEIDADFIYSNVDDSFENVIDAYNNEFGLDNTDKHIKMLTESFNRDHSQLNHQLNQLTQFTNDEITTQNILDTKTDNESAVKSNNNNYFENEKSYVIDGENSNVDDGDAIDLNNIENIDIDYTGSKEDISASVEDLQREIEVKTMGNDNINEHVNEHESEHENEHENDTVLLHVKAIQDELISETDKSNDKELEEAVEAVAVAVAVANSRE